MKTNPEHTKEMLRHKILDRKLNESGLYMNPKLGRFINEAMQEYSDECNSALASHVQSELSTKISEVGKTFTDEWIDNEYGRMDSRRDTAIFIRDGILKLLKGE